MGVCPLEKRGRHSSTVLKRLKTPQKILPASAITQAIVKTHMPELRMCRKPPLLKLTMEALERALRSEAPSVRSATPETATVTRTRPTRPTRPFSLIKSAKYVILGHCIDIFSQTGKLPFC